MGIIVKQTIKGTIYSYLGILIGFLTVNIIQPHALTTGQVGLTSILTSFTLMFAQFSILGFNGTARYFPYFRNEEKKHHGYLFLACIVAMAGTLLFVLLAFIFKNNIVNAKSDQSRLFREYYWYLIPLTFFTLYFNVFDLYARMLYNITTGLILREFTKRVFILITVLLIYYKLVGFGAFMQVWLLANIIPTVLIVVRLAINGQLFLKPDFKFLDRNIGGKMLSICFFTILTGTSPLIIQNVDTYLIYKKFGLSDTGIYNVAFYFAMVIALPSRSLYSIAYTIIAEAWKSNELENIINIYKKSCINQLVGALFIFLLIWANVNNLFKLLPPEYSGGKYVIFFVSLGFLIDSATGVNGVILATSKYFKADSLFYVSLIGVTIASNLLLIPIYGITGAAVASAITFFVINLFRYIFILIAFRMQPYDYKCLLSVAISVGIYYLSLWIIPVFSNFIVDAIVRSLFITILFVLLIYYFKLSEDINLILKKYIFRIRFI